MGEREVQRAKKNICVGILAHVDAGKTTLSEGILYQTGTIRRLGRVDNRDAFLDTYELERTRGITIFSKQAVFDLGDLHVTLLDTPGHVDFSTEMERTLQVLDCAVLVVSGADGVQGHTETLWRLLGRYKVPVFVFVNKMDQAGTDWRSVLAGMRKRLDGNCVPFDGLMAEQGGPASAGGQEKVRVRGREMFQGEPVLADIASDGNEAMEELAMCDEAVLDEFLENGQVSRESVCRMIARRQVFPCYFGSALKLWGVEELLQGLEKFGGALAGPKGTNGALAGPKMPGEPEGANGTLAEPKGANGALAEPNGLATAGFGARVFKISRDEQGSRLTHMKITDGILRVKDTLGTGDAARWAAEQEDASRWAAERGDAARWTAEQGDAAQRTAAQKDGEAGEKVNQIRIYSGAKYETVSEAGAGVVCAVTGPTSTYAGQALGTEARRGQETPMLEPVLTYQLIFPPDCDVHGMLGKMRQLEEEDPMLRIAWNESLGEIQAQVMGQVQIEILKSVIKDRFGVDVEFGAGHIVYKETITAPVEGVGHYEPLRHYAEVHLLMEPAPRGSGLTFHTVCSTDVLSLNWQRLILTHLEEKRHVGVLTGAPVTDMKITLVTGRAHLKHTEGGDFRQATYRAVRQGLMTALAEGNYQLLEPFYRFRLEVPMEAAGRALSDLERMHARFAGPAMENGMAVITGEGPAATMGNYQAEVTSYSKGRGRLTLSLKGYEPCHNTEEVVAEVGYEPELDVDNPCGSVFCSHGAGFAVGWREVKDYMHLKSPLEQAIRREQVDWGGQAEAPPQGQAATPPQRQAAPPPQGQAATPASPREQPSPPPSEAAPRRSSADEDRELEAIFTRTYGERKTRLPAETGARRVTYGRDRSSAKDEAVREEYLLVDGYNIIYAWPDLRELAEATIDGARHRLMDIMCNYQGFTGCILILVFDAYKVEGNPGQALQYHNIHVVYTKEAETADQYIEKLAHRMGRDYLVTVATSDGLEQLIIRGQGCRLMSAADLREAVDVANEQIRAGHLQQFPIRNGNYLLNHADSGLREYLEEVRLGKEGEYHGGKIDKK